MRIFCKRTNNKYVFLNEINDDENVDKNEK